VGVASGAAFKALGPSRFRPGVPCVHGRVEGHSDAARDIDAWGRARWTHLPVGSRRGATYVSGRCDRWLGMSVLLMFG